MDYMNVLKQEDANSLISTISWEDAFLKAAYFCSPTCLGNARGALLDAEVPGNMVCTIVTPNDVRVQLVEMQFIGVTIVSLPTQLDLEPRSEFRNWKFTWWFNHTLAPDVMIVADQLRYRLVEWDDSEYEIRPSIEEMHQCRVQRK